MNPVDWKGMAELQRVLGETGKPLDILAKTNRTPSWKVKAIVGTGEQNDELLLEISKVPEETPAAVVAVVLGR